MKNLVKQLFQLMLLCAFLLNSLAITNAASTEKQSFLEVTAKRENSALESAKVSPESTKSTVVKKSRSRIASPGKINSLRKNGSKAVEKTKGSSCLLVPATRQQEGCFTDCLARYVPPDLVAHCASACGNGDYATCGSCLGLATIVVTYCALSCAD